MSRTWQKLKIVFGINCACSEWHVQKNPAYPPFATPSQDQAFMTDVQNMIAPQHRTAGLVTALTKKEIALNTTLGKTSSARLPHADHVASIDLLSKAYLLFLSEMDTPRTHWMDIDLNWLPIAPDKTWIFVKDILRVLRAHTEIASLWEKIANPYLDTVLCTHQVHTSRTAAQLDRPVPTCQNGLHFFVKER